MAILVENREFFFHPRIFCAPAEGVRIELGFGAMGQKN